MAWSWAKSIVFLGAICFVAWTLVQDKIDGRLESEIEAKLNHFLGGSGVVAQLSNANFIQNDGLHLEQLSLGLEEGKLKGRGSNFYVYDTLIQTPSTLLDLASGNLNITGIELRRAKLTLVRGPDGEWDFGNVVELLKSIQSKQDRQNPDLPVRVFDSEILFIDQTYQPLVPVRVTNVNFALDRIVYKDRPLLRIRGNGASSLVSEFDFTLFIDERSQVWHLNSGMEQASISKQRLAMLPQELSESFSSLRELYGTVSLRAIVEGKVDFSQPPSFHIQGGFSDLTINDPRLPMTIRDSSAKFQITDNQFSVTNFRGLTGDGIFELDYWQKGIFERTDWSTEGFVKGLNFTNEDRIRRWLPEYCKKFCQEYQPSGFSNVRFKLNRQGSNLTRRIEGEILDMDFNYYKFPYPVKHCSGRAILDNGELNFDLKAGDKKRPMTMNGQVHNMGKGSTFEVKIDVPIELPIDKDLLSAVEANPKMGQIVRAFNPNGGVLGTAILERKIAAGNVHKSFDIQLRHCSIRHQHFDYPIHNVSGLVQIRDHDYVFSNLSGSNNSGKIICNGSWDPESGLNLRFLCNSVHLDEELKFALKPKIREIWNGFRPRGIVDFMRVDMRLPIGKREPEVDIQANLRSDDLSDPSYVSIHPTWFPYKIENLTGDFHIGNGRIDLSKVRGRHQKTWVVCEGEGRYAESAWSIRLTDLFVGSLHVDDELIRALPGQLGRPVRQLKYDGQLNVTGEITIAGKNADSSLVKTATATDFSPIQRVSYTPNDRSNTSLAWDLRFDMNEANMEIGIPIENVFGMIQLTGQYDGQTAFSRGKLDVESMTWNGIQITEIKGPFWIDENRVGVGAFASRSDDGFNPISDGSQSNQSILGKMQKGIVTFDANTTFGDVGKFYLQGTLNDGCLATACKELAPNLKNVKGKSFLGIRMTGDFSGSHSYRGDGSIQLRDAKIYELPVFLSLLKILRVRPGDRTAFDASNIDFQLEGENIDFTRMEFLGDPVSLIGNGRMNLDQDIDLNFYSIVGRNRINVPLITDLYKFGSQKILWINVDGTLSNPQTHRHVLPELNDSLKQLFQPRAASKRANLGPPQPRNASQLSGRDANRRF